MICVARSKMTGFRKFLVGARPLRRPGLQKPATNGRTTNCFQQCLRKARDRLRTHQKGSETPARQQRSRRCLQPGREQQHPFDVRPVAYVHAGKPALAYRQFLQARSRQDFLSLAHEVPLSGGDEFADLREAYDALDTATRSGSKASSPSIRSSIREASLATPSFRTRNVPRFRPSRRLSSVSIREADERHSISLHASHIIGWPVEQGRALLDELITFATQPCFVHQHRWRAGDLVVWDNRCTLHRGRPYDDANCRRACGARRFGFQHPHWSSLVAQQEKRLGECQIALTWRTVLAGLTTLAAIPARPDPAWPEPTNHAGARLRRWRSDRRRREDLGRRADEAPRSASAGRPETWNCQDGPRAGQVARAVPDGHTLIAIPGGHATAEALYKKLPYKTIDDFSMISMVSEYPFAFVTHADHKIQTAVDLILVLPDPKTHLCCMVPPGSDRCTISQSSGWPRWQTLDFSTFHIAAVRRSLPTFSASELIS